MTTYNFSTLVADQSISFDSSVDVLHFDAAGSAATAATVWLQFGLGVSYGGKAVYLGGMTFEKISSTSFSFAIGSSLLMGDGSTNTLADWYGQDYTLATSTVGNQVWGLGGADVVQSGSGPDWMVGNVALEPLTHVSSLGATGSPTSSTSPTISADGRYVGFSGGWTGFGSTSNSSSDVLVKDIVAGTVSNEHKNSAGTSGGSGSGKPVISADGSVLVFESASAGLVPGPDGGSLYDIFAATVAGSAIERVSAGTGGTLAADGRSLYPDVSGDGRYVVFESDTSNWAAGGSRDYSDIFLKDRVSGELTRISTSVTGGDGNGDSRYAKVSADGSLVVFESAASNLTAGDTNGYTDIFVWDRTDGSLTNLSSFDPATTRNPNNSSNLPDIAYDQGYGGVVVFQTAKALVAQDTNNQTDVYAFLADRTFQLVSSRADGTGVQLSSSDASVSGDGRFVVFMSGAEDLVPGDRNGYADVFVKDLYTGEIALVSTSAAGVAANQHSGNAEISLGGDWIVFESGATSLAGSTDGNAAFPDVFRLSNPLLRDTLIGGPGNDTYELQRADVLKEDVNGGTDTIRAGIDYRLGSNFENLTLLTYGPSLSSLPKIGQGNELDNVITGNQVDNTLSGFEGNDKLTGGNGDDTLDGGPGADTAVYWNPRSVYTIPGAANGTVTGIESNDTVISIERYQFSDQSLAFDLALGQAAGNTVRIIGAAFDMSATHPSFTTYVGIGIGMFDAGMSTLQACAEVTRIMGMTNQAFVTTVYTNVVGQAPSDADRDAFVGQLQGSGGTLSQAQLLEMAATIGLNETNIGLVGLQQSGVAFV